MASAPLTWHRQQSNNTTHHPKVCKFYLAGNCTRNPCRFLHTVPENNTVAPPKGDCKDAKINKQKKINICKYWMKGNCVHSDKCKFLHAWSYGEGLTLLAQLEGHEKAVTGVTLPKGFDKFFSASKDGTVRVWDCNSGECLEIVNVGSPVECLISEGLWVFAGLTNAVKVWNLQTNSENTLNAPGGQVYAICVEGEKLYAGVGDGSILVWNFNPVTGLFEETALVKGHTAAVISLHISGDKLFSGSMDKSIRVWDLKTMQCTNILDKHTDVVMSFLCWGNFLLSCSLDQTMKIWGDAGGAGIEEVYTHNEDSGILALCGVTVGSESVVLCSSNDNSTRLYELPTMIEKGRVFSREEVRKIEAGPDGLFFSGDATGRVSVWRYSGNAPTHTQETNAQI